MMAVQDVASGWSSRDHQEVARDHFEQRHHGELDTRYLFPGYRVQLECSRDKGQSRRARHDMNTALRPVNNTRPGT